MMLSQSANTETAATTSLVRQATVIMPAVIAILFGTFLVYGAGFAYPSAIHDAAHDVRHAFVFPCH